MINHWTSSIFDPPLDLKFPWFTHGPRPSLIHPGLQT